MKVFAVVGTAGLAAILSMSMPVYAQDESHPQEDKRAQPDAKDARPSDRQDDKRAGQDRGQETNQETNRETNPETNKDKKQDDHARPAERQADQDRNHDRDNRNGEQQARQDERHDQPAQGRQGGRIPDDRFRSNFGRQHTFTVGQPVIVEGAPRFQYGGYWFVIAQPWPGGWGYSDPVYVDYIDGEYFLLSPVHPGVQIAINVIL